MVHLFKLELRKFKLNKKILLAFFAIIICCFLLTVSLVDSAVDPEQTKDTFESTFLVIGILLSCVFMIYSSVLSASFIIEEYNKKTIMILFSYPLNKKRLILLKLLIIMLFCALAMILGYICCCGYIIWIDAAFDLLENSFQLSFLSDWISMAVTSTIVCTLLTSWSFAVGMIKKSVPITIVSSVVVFVIRQVIITSNTAFRENIWQIILVLVLTSIILFFTFKNNVINID